jgi:hypothetical protein
MRKDKISEQCRIIKPIAILLALGLLYLFFFQKFHFGIPCIFNMLTGYKCPGCGMTRAMSEIWNGNFEAAMQDNALSLTVLPVVCIYMLYRFIRDEIKKREGFYIWEYFLLIGLFIIAVGYGFIRNQT